MATKEFIVKQLKESKSSSFLKQGVPLKKIIERNLLRSPAGPTKASIKATRGLIKIAENVGKASTLGKVSTALLGKVSGVTTAAMVGAEVGKQLEKIPAVRKAAQAVASKVVGREQRQKIQEQEKERKMVEKRVSGR